MRIPTALVAALVSVGAVDIAGAEPITSASASATWVENITRCPDPAAAHDAMVYDGTFEARWRNQISRDVSLHFEANAGIESCPRYDGLDRVLLGAQVAMQRKFGLGPFAPLLRATLSYTGSSYREKWLNGTRLLAGLSWSKRWNDNWQTVLTAEYMSNNGRAHVYDYRNRGLSFEAHYDFTERWQLTAGLKRQWGEQMVYAWLGGSGASFPYDYDSWKNTTEVRTYGRDWYAYSMDAHADSAWISISPALGGNRSLPLRLEQTSVAGRVERYKVRMISLSFVQRF